MHRIVLTTAAIAALSLAACNRNGNAGANAAAENATVANAAAVNPATGNMAAATNATVANATDTGAFVDSAVQGNMYEIQAAKIAEKRATSPDVKAFAQLMIKDHTALGEQMKPAVQASGKTAPTSLNSTLSGLLDALNNAPAAQFDKTYIDQQVDAHKQTLQLLQGYAANGADAGLKADAQKAIPMVQAHLDKATALQTKLAAAGK